MNLKICMVGFYSSEISFSIVSLLYFVSLKCNGNELRKIKGECVGKEVF